MSHDNKALHSLLTGAMRRQGLNQSQLAAKLSISLPTLKRWLYGQGLAFFDLLQVLTVLGLSLKDVSIVIEEHGAKTFQYSHLQEEFLSTHIGHLAYFDRLLEGKTPLTIKRRYKLTDHSHKRYQRDLEAIGLIERQPREKVRVLVHGEPQWRKTGPLAKTLRHSALEDICDKKSDELTIALHRYMPDDARLITRMIEDLISAARGADRRARVAESDSVAYGLVLGSFAFEAKFLSEIPNL